MMAIWDRSDNWLAGIANSDHPNHSIKNLQGLTVRDCQAALDATVGKGEAVARDHGTIITVWSYAGYIRSQQRRGLSDEAIAAKIAGFKEHDSKEREDED
jgi:hypothetical protein